MKFKNYQWKLPLPNSKSHIRNLLTVYTYLSFLVIYPMLLLTFFDPTVEVGGGMFVALILTPLATSIFFIYALIYFVYTLVNLIPKKHRKWGWLIVGGLILLGFTGVPLITLIISPFFFFMIPGVFVTLILGYASPVVLFFLGWRRQQEPLIHEQEIDTTEDFDK